MRERFLPAEELVRLDRALDKEESFAPSAVTEFRLLLYTRARLSEIQTLKWDQYRGSRTHLRDSKTGVETIPLNNPTLEVLAGNERVEGNPYVIVGTRESAYRTDLQEPWLKDVRIHDPRHTFASQAVMGGERIQLLGRIGGHTQTQTTARCTHLADDPLQSASNRVASCVKRTLDG